MKKKVAFGIATILTFGAGGTIATDNAINPYTDKGTTLEIADVSSLPEGGTIKNVVSKTEPKITLSKWDGEVAMGVKYVGLPTNTSGSRPFLSKNVEWHGVNETMEAVPITATTTMEDGGMEINIILNSKPASNIFTFQLDNWENLDFFYQAPLWQEAGLIAPTKDCTDTQCNIQNEGMSTRPDNVVGSYAVYYKDHANHKVGSTNYATGKAYHIFRPLVTDANGGTTWADLIYTNGGLSVTVPQSFLDNASYPVKVDPTFGNTTAGGTAFGNGVGSNAYGLMGNFGAYAATSGDTVTDMDFYTDCPSGGSGQFDAAIYSIISNLPSSRLAAAVRLTIINTTPQWNTISVSQSLSAGTTYNVAAGNWLVGGSCGASNLRSYYDTQGSNVRSRNNAPALPASWTDQNQFTFGFSFYATYTASASSPHRVNINSNFNINSQVTINP